MSTTTEKLREEILNLLYDAVAVEGVHLDGWVLSKFLGLIEREKRKAADDVLTRLKVPDLIDEWGAIDSVLDELFPNKR